MDGLEEGALTHILEQAPAGGSSGEGAGGKAGGGAPSYIAAIVSGLE